LQPNPDAVRIDVGSGWLSRGAVVIDRPRERAVFYNLSLWQPVWRVIRPLSTIVGAQISKRQRGTNLPAYGIVIRLFQGDPIRIACRSRAHAIAVLDALHAHFPVEMRTSGRYAPQDAAQDDESGISAQWACTAPHS
jgi:hypothetical protein